MSRQGERAHHEGGYFQFVNLCNVGQQIAEFGINI